MGFRSSAEPKLKDSPAGAIAAAGLLPKGSHAYHHTNPDIPASSPIIYGDYYFAEAVLRLKGRDDLFW